MLLSLAACGGETGTTAKKAQSFTPKLDKDITETLEIAGFMGNFEALDQVMNGFNEYYPNVTFTYDHNTEFMLPDYIASNSGVDLFMTTDQNIRGADKTDYYVQDHCLDLSAEGLDLSALRPEVVSDCTVDGKLLRLPVAMQTYGIVVNKTFLKNEGLSVPTDYEEFLDVMAALKAKGYIPLQGSEQHLYGDLMLNMAMNMVAADAMMPVFERLETIISNGYTDYELNCTYPVDNYDGSIMNFFEGNVPFYVCNAECVSGMKKRESKSEAFSAEPFEYEFMYAPMGDNGVYAYMQPWYGFSVNKDSNQKELAVEFLRFMATKLDEMANIKGLPSVIEGSTNERYSGIEDVKNMQAEFISNGTVSESMCDVIMDICNRFGAGEFQNAQEAMEAFKEQEYKEQEKR